MAKPSRWIKVTDVRELNRKQMSVREFIGTLLF
jgi:hypothetical protein